MSLLSFTAAEPRGDTGVLEYIQPMLCPRSLYMARSSRSVNGNPKPYIRTCCLLIVRAGNCIGVPMIVSMRLSMTYTWSVPDMPPLKRFMISTNAFRLLFSPDRRLSAACSPDHCRRRTSSSRRAASHLHPSRPLCPYPYPTHHTSPHGNAHPVQIHPCL